MSLDRAYMDTILSSKLLRAGPSTSPHTCPPLEWKMHLFRRSCLEDLTRRQLLEGVCPICLTDTFSKLSLQSVHL